MTIVALTSKSTMILKVAITGYIMSSTHVINNLVIIEFMAVSITMVAFKIISLMNMETYLIFFLLILLITESILGLSLLINMIRTHGNDYLKSTNIVKF